VLGILELMRSIGLVKPVHEHTYKEIYTCLASTTVPFAVNARRTFVLHRCTECGDKYVQELEGEWTLPQVRGIEEQNA
jgi:hypothetical protein